MIQDILNKLKIYKQLHLLGFYNILSKVEKEKLLDQLKIINFELMQRLYINSFTNESVNLNEITPIKIIYKDNNSLYTKIGEEILINNQYAIITLAGGSGSRLGHRGPKGTLELNIFNKKITIFEILANQLNAANLKYKNIIPWYIMTSDNNHQETINFFQYYNFFGYPKDNICFFIQDELPVLNKDGNLVLKDKSTILTAPNGNGNIFKALKNNGLINDLKNKNIKWIQISSVDNILLTMVDTNFIGATINSNYKLASKSIFKKFALSKDYVFCKYKNRPYLLDYNFINEELSTRKNKDGEFLYRDLNILIHLLHIDLLEKFANANLPYHRAFKSEKFINEVGKCIDNNERNCFKFEQFIFDAFSLVDDMLLFRVEETKEFAPIKNKEGINSPESAVKLYENYYNSINS